jgi:hypothetical protein
MTSRSGRVFKSSGTDFFFTSRGMFVGNVAEKAAVATDYLGANGTVGIEPIWVVQDQKERKVLEHSASVVALYIGVG